jgi:hypothetical protein
MFGDVACAASPISSTDPRDHPSSVTSSIGATCTAPEEPSVSRMAGTGAANPVSNSASLPVTSSPCGMVSIGASQ